MNSLGHADTVLVIDDEPAVSELVSRLLQKNGIRTEVFSSGAEGLRRISKEPSPSAVFVDLHMPQMDGIKFMREAHALITDLPIVVMTGRGGVDVAVEAMRFGAFDFLTKPFDPSEVVPATCRRALAHAALLEKSRDSKRKPRSRKVEGDLIGQSPAMKRLSTLLDAVAPTPATVLIIGETGTGKELVAQTLHERSLRAQGPFLPINCGALTETLLESELFGHVRGAFTGATNARKGLFEAAGGGTIFLDEVGELSAGMQTSLLRVLQEGEIRPVGADSKRIVDVRVVAATHRDLEKAVRAGSFREDLFYRLNVFPVVVPPLRERTGDIPDLARHFVERHSSRLNRENLEIDTEALAWLAQRAWPGNLRQLENYLERATILARERITVELLESVAERDSEVTPPSSGTGSSRMPYREARLDFERRYLAGLLAESRGSLADAARAAHLDPSNLRRLLKRHRLN